VESKAGKEMNYYRQRDSERLSDSFAVALGMALGLFILIVSYLRGN